MSEIDTECENEMFVPNKKVLVKRALTTGTLFDTHQRKSIDSDFLEASWPGATNESVFYRPQIDIKQQRRRFTDEIIVTPFAQLLASLRDVRSNFIALTSAYPLPHAAPGACESGGVEGFSGAAAAALSVTVPVSSSAASMPVNVAVPPSNAISVATVVNDHLDTGAINKNKPQVALPDESITASHDSNTKEGAVADDMFASMTSDSGRLAAAICCEEERQKIIRNTLSQLDWSLKTLENMLTVRSVGDMAYSKFRKILSRELGQFEACGGPANQQVSKFITSTFLDQKDDSEIHYEEGQTGSTRTNGGLLSSTIAFSDGGHIASSPRHRPYRPLEHADSITDHVPRFGVKLSNESQLAKSLSGLNNWGLDVFQVAEFSNQNPLTAIAYSIFKERGLLKTFRIPHDKFINFTLLAEKNYCGGDKVNPYHNSTHAADVVQSVHYLLNLPALLGPGIFTDLEILAILFASMVHDINHPGRTNQYLVNTESALAVLYNDNSVLENHHLSFTFRLLQDPNYDIFAAVPKKQRQTLRKMIIDMVLATDMSHHMALLANIKTMVEAKKVASSGEFLLATYGERIQVLQNIIHCGDLSNPTKPFDIYHLWVTRVMSEFFEQGDEERAKGLEVSPMCDRNTASIEKSQVGFIDFVVLPLWETFGDLVEPGAQEMLENLMNNRDYYASKLEQQQVVGGSGTATSVASPSPPGPSPHITVSSSSPPPLTTDHHHDHHQSQSQSQTAPASSSSVTHLRKMSSKLIPRTEATITEDEESG